MSRIALKHWLPGVALGMAVTALAVTPDPHFDTSLNTGGCRSCHEGHGRSGSPMLPTAQKESCFACHGSPGRLQSMIARGLVAGAARPIRMDVVVDLPSAHPVSDQAFSRRDPSAVVCTSCHAPHRGSVQEPVTDVPTGQPRLSPRDATRFEYELCESCHGNRGASTFDLLDISRLLTPENRSFHPVHAPTVETSPSVIPSLAGREINCTDCHGNANEGGPRGPHGSAVPYLLRANYITTDGSNESPTVYAMCYRCHDRDRLLNESPFPAHGEHIGTERASCATCHNAHGSVGNRALIRFGEETILAGVSPSISTGRLEFVSDGPGSGACYLTCHGEDHGPAAYGSMKTLLEMLGPDARHNELMKRADPASPNRRSVPD